MHMFTEVTSGGQQSPEHHLQREGESRVAVGCVQEDRACADEASQVRVLLQCGAEAHVAAVHVARTAVGQLKEELDGARAVVGVDQGHLHTWA